MKNKILEYSGILLEGIFKEKPDPVKFSQYLKDNETYFINNNYINRITPIKAKENQLVGFGNENAIKAFKKIK